jgi:AAA domain
VTAPGEGEAPASLVLPGSPPARETLEGWQHWRRTRGTFVPAVRLDRAGWRLLSPRRRMLHDLHRAATHANLPLLQTPMSKAVAKLLRGRIETNALKHKPTTRAGVMITGGGYQGKTETACEVAAAFEDRWLELHRHLNPDALPGTRDLHASVAYVQTPVTAKPKSTCKAILGFYGADTKNMDLPDLIRQVAASLHDHGTRALLLDDITRLRMHRADDQDTLDLIRAFMSMHVTLVLIGVDIPGSGLLREGRHDRHTGQWILPASEHAKVHGLEATQTERRFDLVELDRFRYDSPPQMAAWVQHLAGVEDQLRLMNAAPGMLTDGVMPEYLYRRTNGVVGLLERLMEDGCREAIESGEERLTDRLLDSIEISLSGATGRDPDAGEVPVVPPQPARSGKGRGGSSKRTRGRNTAFDDHGPTAAARTGS